MQWDRGKLVNITLKAERQFDDAFTLSRVDESTIQDVAFVQGMVEIIRCFTRLKMAKDVDVVVCNRTDSGELPTLLVEIFTLCHHLHFTWPASNSLLLTCSSLALRELNEFMKVNGQYRREKQKLLRNLLVVEFLIELVKSPFQPYNKR